MRNLNKYREKRDFKKTAEPSGKIKAKRNGGNIFVVQHHLARRNHFDFRLEFDGTLLSWAVPKGPSYSLSDKRLAIKVEDHPISYAEFEGTIPKGEYGGGTVMVWDKGEYKQENDFKSGLKNGNLKFSLFGERLKGKWALVKIKEESEKENWLLLKEKDEFVKKTAGISKFKTSVLTGRTMTEIERENFSNKKNPFKSAEVKLATLSDVVPSGKEWIFEIKYDGYRILAFCESGKTKLKTRNNKDYSSKFPEIVQSLNDLTSKRACVLDGEVVVFDPKGRSDFGALQNVLRRDNTKLAVFVVFDILSLDGEDLREQPLLKRKDILKRVVNERVGNIILSQYIYENGKDFFKLASKNGLEGIMAKKTTSKYSGTRNEDWLKIKCYKRQ